MKFKFWLILIMLLSHVYVTFAPSGGSAGGSGGGDGGGGGGGGGGSIGDGGSEGTSKVAIIVIFSIVGVAITVSVIACTGKRSILIVQVGLTGEDRSLQKHINETAKATNTSTKDGWHHIFRETTSALLRNLNYVVSAYSAVVQRWSDADAMEGFKYISEKEHKKFDIESLVNFNNVKIQKQVVVEPRQLDKDFIVVIILVATKSAHKLPAIERISDLKETLRYFNSIQMEEISAVEVLWTPQDEKDKLSEEELRRDYPCLKPMNTS